MKVSAATGGALTGADLARWRAAAGLTQQGAADILGVRQGTVSKAERRSTTQLRPPLRDALRVAIATP
jgi:transcriptional regulator with XRE-family HTH domain